MAKSMKNGIIQQVGTPEAIYNEPISAYVADFIGESNIYNGTMIAKKKVRFIGAVWNCIDDFPLNEKVDITIRPEDVIMWQSVKANNLPYWGVIVFALIILAAILFIGSDLIIKHYNKKIRIERRKETSASMNETSEK